MIKRKLKLIYSCVSDVGRQRSDNQDNFICGKTFMEAGKVLPFPVSGNVALKSAFPLAVFDGMGGEERGEMASLLTSTIAAGTDFSGDPPTVLKDFVQAANREVCRFADEHKIRSMGTTAAMLLFKPDSVYMLNVGDSPVFQLSDNALIKISVDDVSVPIAGHKPPLTQNIGIPEDDMTIEPHIRQLPLRKGNRFLIASDGLTDMVPEGRIVEILKSTPTEKAAEALVKEALACGGRDNVTVIVAEIRNAGFLWKGWK